MGGGLAASSAGLDDGVSRGYPGSVTTTATPTASTDPTAAELVLPALRNLRHRLHVVRVIPEAAGVVSVEIGGAQLAQGADVRVIGHTFTLALHRDSTSGLAVPGWVLSR